MGRMAYDVTEYATLAPSFFTRSPNRMPTGTNRPSEAFEAETAWFHIFKAMIESGDLARMDGSTIKVYLVIKAHTNFATGRAFPAIETIAMKAGISEPQVKRCLKALEAQGYIAKERQGRNNVYAFPKRPDPQQTMIRLKERPVTWVAGYIYVASNPAYPGLLKIGRTTQSVESRLRSLSSCTSAPAPFVLEYSVAVEDITLERDIHCALEKYRITPDKEFFRAPLETVVAVITQHIDALDELRPENRYHP